jgi:hypothetical protein
MHERDEKGIQDFSQENSTEETTLEIQIYKRIKVKLFLRLTN